MKCNCHPQSPFHWRDNPRPSIFVQDKSLANSIRNSTSQTSVIERERLNGRDISNVSGLNAGIERLNLRQFAVYSLAVASKK